MNYAQPKSPLTVSQLNRQVKQLLETQYPAIPVQGEISALSRPASGHLYFTLKDKHAQLRCAMFKGMLARSRTQPQQGDEVVALGRLSLYEGRGDYQLIVQSIQPLGAGALQIAFFELKERLAAEGLFDTAHKQPLPAMVKRVGLVTSSSGAALHDILTVLNQRFPAMSVVLYPTQVQGNEAIETLATAIAVANRRREVDVLIVGRGGGSLEDLWCFNSEVVARAIFASELPVISAVGHEVDVTIADFVADHRAATPSQAAEIISPDQYELMQRLDQYEQRLQHQLARLFERLQQRLFHARQRLSSPAALAAQWRQRLNLGHTRLIAGTAMLLQHRQRPLKELQQRLLAANPQVRLQQNSALLAGLTLRLAHAIAGLLQPRQLQLQRLLASLQALSPLATLERGYSISRDAAGKIVRNAADLAPGDQLETLLQQGRVISRVSEAKTDS